MYENSVYEMPSPPSSPLHHLVDREVLADVAQEVDQAELPQPVEVVDDPHGRAFAGLEESRQLRRELPRVRAHLLGVEQLPLAGLAGRIADHPGGAPHQRDDLVAVTAQVRHRHERHQRPRVQAGGRGVEPGVDDGRRGEQLREIGGGGLLDQTSPAQLFEGAHVTASD
jgi:hypothetical protein